MLKKIVCFLLLALLLMPFQDSLASDKELSVHFIDVGQADCIFIQTPRGKNILIDAGTPESSEKIISYLKKHQVNQLDAVFVTHPHYDHIGAMVDIIKTFPIKALYMQGINYNSKPNIKLMNTLQNTDIMVTEAKAGDQIKVEPSVTLKIIAPIGLYEDLNEHSYVIKLKYKQTRFLLMGDAQEQSETDLLTNKVDLKADVIKIGHHGANTGTTLPFLKKVDPEYAIITAKKAGNLPSKYVINRLKYLKIPTYRTDILGNIVVESDGEYIQFDLSQNE